MNATETYRHTADAAQEITSRLVHSLPDAKMVKAAASDAAQRAGQVLEDTASAATEWVGEASSNAVAMLPMVAAKRARRRRRLVGAGLLTIALVYFFDPKNGAERRSRVKARFSRNGAATTTTTPSLSTQHVNTEGTGATVTD